MSHVSQRGPVTTPSPARIDFLSSAVGQPVHRALGLTDEELDRIVALLAREPNHFELAVFSLLWSEHCGYKHSAPLLRRLPSAGERVLQGPGENAGVLDLGDGLAVAFKVESHNHPSAVEPFQGAATGVGGILRDVVAMGARPVALLDGLRFGADDWHFSRAVGGVGHYGNCLAADELVMYRNGQRAVTTSIAQLVEERGAGQGAAWTTEPLKPFEVLSLDPRSHRPQWRPVTRLFKQQASELVEIRAALGRRLRVSPDHPVVIWEAGELVARAASAIKPGDRLPLLSALPTTQTPESIDLVDALDEPMIVRLPRDWKPSRELRVALRGVMPRADTRHWWLKRKELPADIWRAIEELTGVSRSDVTVRLPGPRSTHVPAVFPVSAETARLIGYFVAEGCCATDGTTIRLIWTFGRTSRDTESVADLCAILERLGIRYRREDRATSTAVVLSSRLLGRLFRDVLGCGGRAHEKRIPSIFLQAAEPLRIELLKGIFRGDGCVTYPKRGTRVKISHSTVSRELHDQLLLLLQSLGVTPARHERPPSPKFQSRSVNARQAFVLEMYGFDAVELCGDWFSEADTQEMVAQGVLPSRYAARRARRENARITSVAVESVRVEEGPHDVYDFEVPGTHLFVTSGGLVTHNCVGVPNVGGEVVFDGAYADNCLVNAMCVGLLPVEHLMRAKATTAGSLVVLYGATTGRDGIGGASVLASQELGEEAAEKRPSVQVGDPFTGKKLIEVSVELVERGLVDSLQDCGAAGLASSLSEMAADYGIDVHLDRVPLREEGMEPWEVMISESQERMVAIVAPERLAAVQEVCDRWELHHAVVGEVTDTGELRAYWEDELVGAIPARHLTDDCPRYAVARVPRPAPPEQPLPETPATADALLGLLGSDALRSRRFVYRRFDQLVQSRTVRRPGLDAAVLRLRPSYRGLAVTLDGTGRVGSLDPFTGGALAVLEAARNVACVGGEPLGVTDCLNFGNPEKAEIGWELAEAIEGIAQACEGLGIPVVSGNVSLYNDTNGRSIPPTPVVGCVGLVDDVRRVPRGWQPGDRLYVASVGTAALAGSEYQARYGTTSGAPPTLALAAEAALVRFLTSVAPRCALVHDAAEGGLAVALAEAALWSGSGAQLDLPDDHIALFGEGPGQALLALAPEAREPEPPAGVELRRLGTAGGARLLGVGVDQLRAVWERD
jgi:phosphoribosylformylglycinamidine synthase subunit PurL